MYSQVIAILRFIESKYDALIDLPETLKQHGMDKIAPGQYLHGIQVGVAAYIMTMTQDYRVNRVRTFLTDTGFFKHLKHLKLKNQSLRKR